MVTVYIFECLSNIKIHGYTKDKAGSNLPTANCKGWKFHNAIEVDEATPAPRVALNVKDMLKGINDNGYYLGGSEIIFTERTDL